MASLRLLHIVFGVLLVGNVFFLTLFLEPRLRGLGPAIQNPVMAALMPVVTGAQILSFSIVVATGVAITLVMRWNSLGSFLQTGWGWAILAGFVVTIAAGVVGFGFITPLGLRIQKLGRSIQERPPSPEEAQQLERLGARLVTLSRTNFVLALIVVAAMAIARYV